MDASTAQTNLTNWESAAAALASAAVELASGAAGSTISVASGAGSWSVTRENFSEVNEVINKNIAHWQKIVDTYNNANRRSAKQVQFHQKNR